MSEPTPTDRAEAAATRRRWVSLAELVGVGGLVIAALGLWSNWSDRRTDLQEKHIESVSEARSRAHVRLSSTAAESGERLVLKDGSHDIQSIDIRFPTETGIAEQVGVLEPHIDAAWIAPFVLKATEKGASAAEGRLPVLITSTFSDGDGQRTDTALYEIIWSTHGRALGILRGRALELKRLMLRERTTSSARLDAIWAKDQPKP